MDRFAVRWPNSTAPSPNCSHGSTSAPSTSTRAFESTDRPALRALPAEPCVFAQWKKVRVPLDSHVGLDRHDCSVPHPPGRAPTPRPIHRPHRRAPRPRAAHRLTPPLPPARAPYHHPRAHARAPPALRPTGLPRALLAIGVGPISWTPDSLGRRCPPCRNRDRRAREARRDGGEDEEWRKGRGETFIRHSPPCGARWCEGSRRAREACRDGWRGRRSGGEEEKPLSGTVPLAGCARVKEAAGHGKHVVTGEEEAWRKGGGETLIRHSPPCGGALV